MSSVHTRRTSKQTGSPDFNLQQFEGYQQPSPYLSRTPKLEGGGFDRTDRKKAPGLFTRYRKRDKEDGPLAARILSLLARSFRTPRALAMLASVVALWIVTMAIRANSHVIAQAPVPQAFIPIIRHGGVLLHRIAPKAGSKVKDWSDSRIAKDPNRRLTEEELAARSSHTFHPNGLLLVNPKGRHPIHTLIERAEQNWKAKVARQSRTLQEAVREYKYRYKRNPPKGFDDWWNFAEANNVQLRDEYDQIDHDMAPHRALEPSDSRHRNRVMQERDHTFTIALTPGEPQPKSYGKHAGLKRATDLMGVLNMFSGQVPQQINLTFVIDDNPAVMLPYTQRDRMVELSQQGEYYGPSEFVEADDPTLSNFAQACAPNSPLRRSERGEWTHDYGGTNQRSFIWDHAKAVDLCQHPESRALHGHTMQPGVPLGPLVPLFTWAKTRMHADILCTPLEQYSETYIGYDPPWEGKSHNKLLWRGTTTGSEFDKHTPWKLSQRARLHMMTHELEGQKEVMWSQRGAIRHSNMTTASLNHLYMDTSFAGQPEQCDPETCQIMRDTIKFADRIGLDDSNQYKYLFDVDGNGWSGRFHRLMSTRSLVLKSTVFPEWYQDRIQPWVHYVPIKVDYSDLYDIMAFFIGTPDGQGGHDSIAERLAENGRVWARDHWRKADMASYMYRLVLEYSRILHFDSGDDVDYIDASAFDL